MKGDLGKAVRNLVREVCQSAHAVGRHRGMLPCHWCLPDGSACCCQQALLPSIPASRAHCPPVLGGKLRHQG